MNYPGRHPGNKRPLNNLSSNPGSSFSKESTCNSGDRCSIAGLGRSPGEGNGNPPSILAWEVPRTEEPGRLQSMGLQEPDMTYQLNHYQTIFPSHPCKRSLPLRMEGKFEYLSQGLWKKLYLETRK